MSDRIRKINELIREETGRAILAHLKSHNLITVKAVETSQDLKNAIVWISVLGDADEGMKHLAEKSRMIEREVRAKMFSRNTPRLEFKLDRSAEYVENIEKLLNERK